MRNIFFIYINNFGRNSKKHCGDLELTGYRSPSKILPSIHHGREDIKGDRVNKVTPQFLQKKSKTTRQERLTKGGDNKGNSKSTRIKKNNSQQEEGS